MNVPVGIGKVEDVKPVLYYNRGTILRRRIFLPGWIMKQADFIRFGPSRIGYHMVLGFRLFVHCRFVAVW